MHAKKNGIHFDRNIFDASPITLKNKGKPQKSLCINDDTLGKIGFHLNYVYSAYLLYVS